MGADARWVCHTCKTVCSRGGTPVVYFHGGGVTVLEVRVLLESVNALGIEEDHFFQKHVIVSFLSDLAAWLGRHEGHEIHIGSDYTTDMMDLDDYYDETVEGKKDTATRFEARASSVEAHERRSLQDIRGIIQKHGLDSDGAARELYNRFSMGDL